MSDPSSALPTWCEGDDWCPMESTAAIIGKKWHPVIVHTLLENGPLGFNALQRDLDGISSKVLSESLEDMEEKRLVERRVISETPFRVEYALTEHGESLEPVIDAMTEWGATYLEEAAEPAESIV